MVKGELLFVLTERERALLRPELDAMARAQQVMSEVGQKITRMVRLRAGRDDVVLNLETFEVHAQAPEGSVEGQAPPPAE